MRVPGCGVPPPPDSRRFNSNNSQITNNINCNDCNNNRNTNNNNNNNNDNVNEIFGSPKSVESNDNIGYQANNWPIARGNQREGITSGGCLEHQDSTGCLTAETARPTPLPPQRTKGRPLFIVEFFAHRKFTPKTRAVIAGARSRCSEGERKAGANYVFAVDAERLADQLEHQRPTAAIVGVARRRDDATGEHRPLARGARCEPASACTTADVPATHVHPGHTEELHGGTGCLDLPAGPFRRTGGQIRRSLEGMILSLNGQTFGPQNIETSGVRDLRACVDDQTLQPLNESVVKPTPIPRNSFLKPAVHPSSSLAPVRPTCSTTSKAKDLPIRQQPLPPVKGVALFLSRFTTPSTEAIRLISAEYRCYSLASGSFRYQESPTRASVFHA
ncbi:hypothetical protein K0M31_006098 [Melipona bicolor]|uniref:Uncharacterized protein n=1 Tax=Melipona bicolor TaxID=60889 RepID=A0AA40KLK6_9HYME|nr:hypothetical protein K0M31_006098 [Melipona bicolor]